MNKEYDPLLGHNESRPERNRRAGSNCDLLVDDVIDHGGFGLFQIFIVIIGGLAWTADAVELVLLSILGPVLLCEWQLSSSQEALIISVSFLGYFFGAPAFGYLGDKYGRKMCLVLGACLVVFYGILSSFAPHITWLLILRFLTGFSLGSTPQVMSYCAEFAPTKHRGKMLMVLEGFFGIGSAMAAVLALLVLTNFGWRLWVASCVLPSLAFLMLYFCMPETPRFHAVTGQPEKAWKTLEMMAKLNKCSLPKGKLVAKHEERRGRVMDLLQPEHRKTSFLLAILWFIVVFVYYGYMLLTTELVKVGTTCPQGKRAITDASDLVNSCSLECKTLTVNDLKDIVITSLGEVPGVLLAAVFVDIIGRRMTIAISFGACLLVFGSLIFCVQRTFLVVLLTIGRAMIGALQQTLFVYTPEAYPTTFRSVAMGASTAVGKVGAMITPYVAQVIGKESIVLCLCIYGLLSLVGLICSFLLPLETKGRNLK